MKKLILFLLLVSLGTMQAQNFQFLGGTPLFKGNPTFTNFVTFELYKNLKNGPLYYFTDFKINHNGTIESYSEISKYWVISKLITITFQYNAGLNKDYIIKPVYLAGFSHTLYTSSNFNLSVDLMYRYQSEVDKLSDFKTKNNELPHGFQITPSFSENLNKIQISGYCDIWPNQTSLYYIFEPQAWYKFSKQLYAGMELRLSNYDILDNYKNYLMVGFKWNLE
jgi:hypothetical protein